MDIVVTTGVIAALFLVIGIAEPLAARVRLPYTVILALVGILIASGAVFFLRTNLTDAVNPIAEAVVALPIRSNVFLYVFLPTLLFQAALCTDVRRMLDDWVPIVVLAVVAVAVATAAVGLALALVSTLPLVVCLLIGSIVSTTDPSAVVSIFRSISAPQRLARLIEGESLLNDAAAIALFGLFLAYVMIGIPDPTLSDALWQFPVLIFGGAFVGWLAARIAVWLMALVPRHELAQLSISVALPYLAYISAEQSVGASGVIAVVVAGMTLNMNGPGRLSPATWSTLQEVWTLLAHWAGGLIFILAALLIPRLLEEVRTSDIILLLTVTLAALSARAVILFGMIPLLARMRVSPPISRPYRTAILWGGLRGAVTLALALAVTESIRVPVETKRLVAILATGFTLFTLLVQGTTLRALIGSLGLDRLSPIDQALSKQVVAVSLQTVREDVARTTETYDLTHDIVRSEAKAFGERLDAAVHAADESREILDRDRITLGLIALAGAERDAILEGVRDRVISTEMSGQALAHADRLIEATRAHGRTGYLRASQEGVAYSGFFRAAMFLHTRIGIGFPVAQATAQRFGLLMAQRLILQDLDRFIESRIRRIHGRRVADLLKDFLQRRVEIVEAGLEGLRLQYPGYAEELERTLIQRTALRLEEREYKGMRDDGLIGAELYTALTREIDDRLRATETARTPDVALRASALVRQVPLFSELDDGELKRLGRALKASYASPGEVVLRRDIAPKRVFFIASGAVELETGGQSWRLGRGDMFGHLALLAKRPVRVEARALTPSTFLVLDEARFRRLMDRAAPLRRAVAATAKQRGITLDLATPT
ncbi:MAG: cation:proton antiporter [Pseudomonadota bacterium]